MAETSNFSPDIEAAAQRIKQTSDRVLELSKENGLAWLEAYEKMLNGVLKLEEETARTSERTGSTRWCRHRPIWCERCRGRS